MLRPASAVLLWLGGVSSALLGGTGARPLAPSAITELTNKGYTVCSDFLSTQEVSALSADISLLRTQSRFSVAGVGEQGSTARVDTGVRVCEQCFLYPRLPSNAGDPNAREALYARIGGVLAQLDDEVGTKLEPLLTEGLYAYYPNGGFYKRHVDAAAGEKSTGLRAWSYLIYLNKNWREGDGGELRIYGSGGAEDDDAPFVDVPPKAGTLVLFRSDTVPHEVLETSAERLAIAGWLSRPVEGSQERRTLIGALAAAVGLAAVSKALTGK